jgi:NDP-sugar pyrophosphorylase family protein
MVQKHFQLGKLVTMGLISKPQTKTEGSAVVDGDYVIQFHEKSEHFITNIVNAGIYIIKPEALTLLEGKQNVEHELFPKLAKLKQMIGFFIYGGYEHLR